MHSHLTVTIKIIGDLRDHQLDLHSILMDFLMNYGNSQDNVQEMRTQLFHMDPLISIVLDLLILGLMDLY